MVPLIPLAMSLAQFAPGIIKWMSGSDQAEAVAQNVVGIAQQITGMPTPDGALASITGDPEKALEFRKAVMVNAAEYDRMYLADTQNARDRDVKLHQAGYKNPRANWMLALTYGGIVGLVALMVFRDIDANTALGGVVLLLIGKLISQWEQGFSFEFGTTRTNKEKDETIKRLTK